MKTHTLFGKLFAVLFITASVLFSGSPALAVVGEVVVANSGESLPRATVTFETADGETLTTAQTDNKGAATLELPETTENRQVVVKVEDKDGKVTKKTFVQPAGEPWYLVAMDTAGGIIGYTRQAFQHIKTAAGPITVGANSDVGSGARMKKKAMGAVGGLVGGLMGGGGSPFGGSAGGGIGMGGGGMSPFGGGPPRTTTSGSGGKDIKTVTDPIPQENKRIFTDPATGIKIAVGIQVTPNGLLVSTDILNSPDKGTFQTVYLMDPKGRRAGPTRYDIYQLYMDWKLTVTWTRDRWVNGQHVEHSEGGWSEGGRDILGTFEVPRGKDGIWSKMGFSNASEGIMGLGAFFPISSQLLQSQPMNLVIHITRPSQTTVTTAPFVIGMTPFVWSDQSSAAHGSGSADFMNDHMVDVTPTATLIN